MKRHFQTTKPGLLTFILCFVFASSAHAQTSTLPESEKTKIEALIANIENLKDAKFVRNGSEYDAKTAAKFLRGKLKANAKDVASAADFIAKIATRSSTSGKPYLIRMKDGSEIPCADFLNAELKKLE